MNVSIFGLGYVGCVTAACLAEQGHSVMGVDISADKVRALNEGRSPIVEPGLDDLVRQGVTGGRITATDDAARGIDHADVCLVSVGTPSNPNGSLNLEYVDRVFHQIGQALADAGSYKAIVLRSTVLPGTLSERLVPALARESGKDPGADYGVATNPEFLREGSAIADFRNPPFTVIGQGDERVGEAVAALYQDLPAPIIRTDPDTACMVKYASNAFHALKVTFANEIGRLCKQTGVDATGVMDIFCRDSSLNISPRYLKPGFAFGGSCLPKDLRALLYLARHRDLQVPVLESVLPSNQVHLQSAIDMILNGGRRQVGVIGLSFKPDTDDLRESPVVELVETLSGKGMDVRVWDENVNLSRLTGRNKAFIETTVPHISALMRPSLEEVVTGSDVVVVSHNLPHSRERLMQLLTPDQMLVDLVKIMSNGDTCRATYQGICW